MEQGAFSRISEQILFKFRGPYIILTVLLTVWFAWEASRVRMDASLEKMVPLKHEYIQNLFKHKDELSLGNDLKIAIETVDGDIFTKEFLEVVRKVTDEAFYVQGVDKSKIQSLWTANVRWVEVTEEGFKGG